MIKTTNYEISKKLAEIGFKANAEKCWAKIRHSILSEFNLVNLDFQVPQNCDEWVLSYDLETLLDALPKKLKKYGELGTLFRSGFILGYNLQNFDDLSQLLQYQRQGESLADTAGLLIIWLYEENLIKF
jgi:hypothetical protein